MSTSTAESTDTRLVWSLGCGEATRSLADLEIESRSWRSFQQLLEKQEGSERLRAILLHKNAFQTRSLSDAIRSLRARWPLVDVLVWAPGGSGEIVRESLHAGALDVMLSRSPARFAETVSETLEKQRFLPRLIRTRYDGSKTRFEGMLSRSRSMWDLFDTCQQVARTDATVLIFGETGTGKELVARAIHRRSGRTGRFVAVNCGGIPQELIESELFGHVKGTFTGASADKPGLFRHADEGTLFLDEIGNISPAAQFSLLRALQEGAVRPVGGHEEIPVNVRIVAATSMPLEAKVQQGAFREDLFYRLDVIRLYVPPLRERSEDILFLFAHFASRAAKQYRLRRAEVGDGFIDELLAHSWPGNVRELENFAERVVLTTANEKVLTAGYFRRLQRRSNKSAATAFDGDARDHIAKGTAAAPRTLGESGRNIDTSRRMQAAIEPMVEELERAYLTACLAENNGRVGAAAGQAGISRRTLLRKMKKYGLAKEAFRS